MSEIEIDLVRFTAGPRKGQLAVAVGHDYWNQIVDLHGEPIIEWDGMSFTLDESEWTYDMHIIDEWLKQNEWDFIYPPNAFVQSILKEIALGFSDTMPVVIGRNQPKYPPHYIIIVNGAIAIILGVGLMSLMTAPRKD